MLLSPPLGKSPAGVNRVVAGVALQGLRPQELSPESMVLLQESLELTKDLEMLKMVVVPFLPQHLLHACANWLSNYKTVHVSACCIVHSLIEGRCSRDSPPWRLDVRVFG